MTNARTSPTSPPPVDVATFAHTVHTKANSIKFAHQSFCSPRLSTFLKAIRCEFLKGCPNLSAEGVTRYLNPSPASSKGHMKRPHQGIRSTRPRVVPQQYMQQVPQNLHAQVYADNDDASSTYESNGRVTRPQRTNLIKDDVSSKDGNIFCFGAFADKHTGVVYSDLTGTFPYMSLEGNVCFFVVYHYESNAILGLPIKNMEDSTIFEAYKQQFKFLKQKGFTIKLNVMDNQASRQIKSFLTTQDCDLLLVEPHNHRVNAAKRAIQTFKDHFVRRKVLTLLNAKLANHNNPPSSDIATHEWMLPDDDPQRLPPMLYNAAGEQRVAHTLPEQRVPTPSSLHRITNAPPIMAAPNPTNKWMIKMTPRSHVRVTRNNIPGSVPAIRRQAPVCPNPAPPPKNTTPRRSLRVPKVKFAAIPGGLRSGKLIRREAINFLTKQVWAASPEIWMPNKLKPTSSPSCLNLDQVVMPMIHPITGETISSYKKLMHDPATKDIWQWAFSKDFGGMAQGCNKMGQKGTNAIFVMTHAEIPFIPKDRTVTYARVVVDFRPQKADPHRIRITAGGNLINYPCELSTRMADLTTSKLMWNSVLSTEGAKYMCLDIKIFYLSAPLDRFEYMKIPLVLFPQWTINQYDLTKHALNGFVYLEMRRAVWGLPQLGILANKLLHKHLLPHGYYECANTPGLWKHVSRLISFTLVVDDFGVKYVGKEHANHLIDCIKEKYGITEDWSGDLYCGIKLKWDYNARTLDISMPGYIKKLLQKYQHRMPKRPQNCPYSPAPKQYGVKAQAPLPVDISRKLSPEEIKEIQHVVGSILYYARAEDITVLMALSSIAIEQTKGTTSTWKKPNNFWITSRHILTQQYVTARLT